MRINENWTATPETIARIVHAFDVVLDSYRDLKFCQDGVTVALFSEKKKIHHLFFRAG